MSAYIYKTNTLASSSQLSRTNDILEGGKYMGFPMGMPLGSLFRHSVMRFGICDIEFGLGLLMWAD